MKRMHRLSVLELLEGRLVPTAYVTTNLVSDQPGVAPMTDPTLVNAWGIAVGPRSFWVSANGTDLSEVYVGDVAGSPLIAPFKVAIPGGAPTGQVANLTNDFVVSDGNTSGPAAFIFASESGAVTGWNPTVPAGSRVAQPAFQADDGAIYKGIALANNGSGNFLYLADFHNGKIDVLDSQYDLAHLAGDFTDPHMKPGFAPFNVAAIGNKLYVTYAKQDADAEDDVTGKGLGFVNVFDLNGNFLNRFVNRGRLNAPWAVVQAPPSNFGQFSGDILIGNFGDGRINAYDPVTREFQGVLSSRPGRPIEIDGLWGLAFGNGSTAGDANALYFAAGPDDETHGLFGSIRVAPDATSTGGSTSGFAGVAGDGLGSRVGGTTQSPAVRPLLSSAALPVRALRPAPVVVPSLSPSASPIAGPVAESTDGGIPPEFRL
jgi:uncharacterized protein (TIGR03118 family)